MGVAFISSARVNSLNNIDGSEDSSEHIHQTPHSSPCQQTTPTVDIISEETAPLVEIDNKNDSENDKKDDDKQDTKHKDEVILFLTLSLCLCVLQSLADDSE